MENCPKESWVPCLPSHFLSPTHWLWFWDESPRPWQNVPETRRCSFVSNGGRLTRVHDSIEDGQADSLWSGQEAGA